MTENTEQAAQRADTILGYGFFAAYIGVVGGLLAWTVPALEGVRVPLVLYGLVPFGAIGVATVIAANLFRPRGKSQPWGN